MAWQVSAITIAIIPSIISAVVSIFVSKSTLKSNYHQRKIERICERIESLMDDSALYWSLDGKNSELERNIKTNFHHLNTDVLDLKKRLRQKHSIDDKLRLFRREVTGGLFESPQKVSEPGRINQIHELAEEFRKKIKCICK